MMDSPNPTTAKKKIYYGVDFFKLVCALLIVLMHSNCRDIPQNDGTIGNWMLILFPQVGVPFFFVVSGFFLTKGIMKHQEPKEYVRSYFLRIFKMYVFWSVATLPLSWMCIEVGHPDYPLYLKCIYLVRMFLISGSLGIYWYILSMLYVAVIFYYCEKYHKIYWMYAVAFALWILGLLYDSKYNTDSGIFTFIHVVFSSSRNFLNVGLIYMSVGHFMAHHENKIHIPWALVILIVIASWILKRYDYTLLHVPFGNLLVAISLFLLSQKLEMNWLAKHSLHVRKLSTAIYLGQFPFLLVFDFYLRKGTILDFSLAVIFSITLYLLVINLLPKKWSDIIYG